MALKRSASVSRGLSPRVHLRRKKMDRRLKPGDDGVCVSCGVTRGRDPRVHLPCKEPDRRVKPGNDAK